MAIMFHPTFVAPPPGAVPLENYKALYYLRQVNQYLWSLEHHLCSGALARHEINHRLGKVLQYVERAQREDANNRYENIIIHLKRIAYQGLSQLSRGDHCDYIAQEFGWRRRQLAYLIHGAHRQARGRHYYRYRGWF